MAELKPGGLAMVIGGSPDLYGFVLRTEKLVMPGEQFTGPDGIVSRNDIVRPKWLCIDDRITVRLKDGTETDELLQTTIILFGLVACFIAWIAILEETGDFLKGCIYFVGTAAASSLFTIGWFIHG